MKFFLVVLALVAAVAAEEWAPKTTNEEFKAIRAQCLASNPLSAEALASLDQLVYPNEEPVRKYLLCVAKKLGLFMEQQGFLIERIVAQFKNSTDEAEATEIIKKCFEKKEEMSSDMWMYLGHKCMLNSKLGAEIKDYVKKGKQAS